jgi:hypothetical protein
MFRKIYLRKESLQFCKERIGLSAGGSISPALKALL